MKEIKLNGKRAAGKVCLVDDEDYEWLNKYKWHVNVCKTKYSEVVYVIGSIPIKEVSKRKDRNAPMHRLIMGVTDPKILIDHKDRNPLNNQRSNLRIATPSQNTANSKRFTNSTNKYKGVLKLERVKGFVRYIVNFTKTLSNNKVVRFHFSYKNEVQAALMYNELSIKYHGEFAILNVIAEEDMVEYYKYMETLPKVGEKRCASCRNNYSFIMFTKTKNTKDGYCCYCKNCKNIQNAKRGNKYKTKDTRK
jgi:hypothetical protein